MYDFFFTSGTPFSCRFFLWLFFFLSRCFLSPVYNLTSVMKIEETPAMFTGWRIKKLHDTGQDRGGMVDSRKFVELLSLCCAKQQILYAEKCAAKYVKVLQFGFGKNIFFFQFQVSRLVGQDGILYFLFTEGWIGSSENVAERVVRERLKVHRVKRSPTLFFSFF